MLLEAIRQNSLYLGAKAAYRSGGEILTYAQLWAGAERLATVLRRQGTGPVLVYGHKQPLMPAAFLACLLAGRAYLPCDESCPTARLQAMCKQAGATLALTGSHTPALEGLSVLDPVRLAALCANAPPAPLVPLSPQRDAYILFTSGSTGQPKGVRVSYSNLEHFVRWLLAQPAVAACGDGVSVNQALFSFDLSVADLYPTWVAGGTVFALTGAETRDLPLLYAALANSGAARLTCTPSFARLCLCDKTFGPTLLPNLKTLLFCGEALAPKTANQLWERFPTLRVMNAYGPTEATCMVCAAELGPGPLPAAPCPVGRADGAAVQLLIVDEEGRVLPKGQRGEICLCGASVAAGYTSGEAGGFFCLKGLPTYRTGDLGYLQNGFLWFLGRLDRQIKYKGYRVEPAETEAALLALPGVTGAAVLPVFVGETVAGLAAFVQWQGPPPCEAALNEALARTLPAYLLPRRYFFLPRLPLTASGKCDYIRLKEML